MRLESGFTYSIIGLGRVGAALDAALNSIGGKCTGNYVSRSKSKILEINKKVNVLDSVSELNPADFVFLCVPDDSIESVSNLLPIGVLKESNAIVSHVSGNKPSSILSHLADMSIPIASSHPLMTFKLQSELAIFDGITVSLEGNEYAVESLHELFTKLGSKPIVVTPEQKKLLHVAAVITSNFMSSLIFHASDVLKSIDDNPVDFTRSIFGLLMLKTAENIMKEGYPSALTGPASRGDTSTIDEHLQLLKKYGIDDTVYRELTDQILHFKNHK